MQQDFKTRRNNDKFFEKICKFSVMAVFLVFTLFIMYLFFKGMGAFYSTYAVVESKDLPQFQERIALLTSDHKIPEQDLNNKQISIKLKSDVELYIKNIKFSDITNYEKEIIDELLNKKIIRFKFNLDLIKNPDSRYPEKAGIYIALIGSLLTICIALLVALPMGVIAGIYLEEMAKPGKIKNILEVNINNLAAIPSIIYGLFGLFVFIYYFRLPRSSFIVAGFTLSFMMLPIIVMTTKQALKSIPNHIRYAALALGATRIEMVMHQLLPIAFPQIITGVILSIARIFGETAPLILLGLVSFIANVPKNILDPVNVLPVQIYLWSNDVDIAYIEKAFGAIIILVLINLIIYSLANFVKRRYEQRYSGKE